MRARIAIPVLAAAGLVPVAIYWLPREAGENDLARSSAWPPSRAQMASSVGKSGPVSRPNDARHVTFANMAKQRYRDHEMAVGVRFDSNSLIRVMYAPIIPRWYMAQVATEVRNDAEAVLGARFDVDLYETYITAPMRKLAELRRGKDGRTHIAFSSRFGMARVDAPPTAAPRLSASQNAVGREESDLPERSRRGAAASGGPATF